MLKRYLKTLIVLSAAIGNSPAKAVETNRPPRTSADLLPISLEIEGFKLPQRPSDTPAAYFTPSFSEGILWPRAFNPNLKFEDLLQVIVPAHGKISKNANGGSDTEVTLSSGNKIVLRNMNGAIGALTENKKTQNEFITIVKNSGKAAEIFSENPYYQDEQKVQERLQSNAPGVAIPLVSSCKDSDISDGILIVPDKHGSKERIQHLLDLVNSKKFKWIAMEMFPAEIQPVIDQVMASSDLNHTGIFQIFDSLNRQGWGNKFKDLPQGQSINRYMDIFYAALRNHMKFYAMDAENSYVYSRNQATILVEGTRNRAWASHVASIDGPGIIFGGQLHFMEIPGANVQDFLVEKFGGSIKMNFVNFYDPTCTKPEAAASYDLSKDMENTLSPARSTDANQATVSQRFSKEDTQIDSAASEASSITNVNARVGI